MTGKIAYALLALFLTLHDLDPLPADSWEIRDHGAHQIWTIPALAPPTWDSPGFYMQLSCELWDYVEHHNKFRGVEKFQMYDVEEYPNRDGTATVVYVSICQ